MTIIYLDISPLTEPQWSGIARLTAKIVEHFLGFENTRFFYRDLLVDNDSMTRVLKSGSCFGLLILMRNRPFDYERMAEDLSGSDSAGLYTNLKFDQKKFRRLFFVANDISFLLTPELHNADMTRSYRELFFANVRDADRVLAISGATKRDLTTYFAKPDHQVFVGHPGCDAKPGVLEQTRSRAERSARPYFLILGTIEPRKNIVFLLDFVKHNRELLRRYDFVFVGKNGWGPTWNDLVDSKKMRDPRIAHRGYVSDQERDDLIDDCEAVVFPSLFEGYGLPVLEAMARGKIVLGSRSSGIVEAGGGHMIEFDPTNLSSLKEAFAKFENMSDTEKRDRAKSGYEFAKSRSWSAFIKTAMGGFGMDLVGTREKSIDT